MKYAIKTRWLGYDHKWHQKTTKWYDFSGDAWDEAYKIEKSVNYLEMSRGLLRKE